MANEQKDVIFDAGVNLAPEEVEKQLKQIEALIEKYLGPKSITPKIREGLRKRIETIPDYTEGFLRKRSQSGVSKELSSIVKSRETELKVQKNLNKEQKAYNKKIEKLMDMLKNKKYGSLSEFYDIGKGLKTATHTAEINGLDVTTGTDAYNEYLKQEDDFLNVGKKLKGIISSKEIAQMQLPLVTAQIRALREEIVLTSAKSGDIKELTKEFNRLAQIEKKLKKATGLSSFGKLLNRFKSYATIRIFRNLFSSIEQGMGASINSLASFSSDFRGTMSSITSQFQIMSSAIALILQPMLEVIEPVLKNIANVIANVANSISYFVAKLKGSGTYLKINTEYLKEFNEEINNTSFDKFETLSNSAQEIDPSKMFEEANVSDGLTKDMERVSFLLAEIGVALAGFATIKIIAWIMNGDSEKAFGSLKNSLGSIKTKINDISKAGLIAGSAFAFVTSIINLIDVIRNWDSQSLVTQISAITAAALGLLSVVFAILAAIPGIGHASLYKALAVGLTASTILATGISVMKFEDGGLPQQGSLFVAGEAGAEFVTKMPSGQTGVTNITQFKQAMVEALYECADIFQQSDGSVILYLDGAEVARSKRFKSELNRTNSGLNLR